MWFHYEKKSYSAEKLKGRTFGVIQICELRENLKQPKGEPLGRLDALQILAKIYEIYKKLVCFFLQI